MSKKKRGIVTDNTRYEAAFDLLYHKVHTEIDAGRSGYLDKNDVNEILAVADLPGIS